MSLYGYILLIKQNLRKETMLYHLKKISKCFFFPSNADLLKPICKMEPFDISDTAIIFFKESDAKERLT